MDIGGSLSASQLEALREDAEGFRVTGYRLELSGFCPSCAPEEAATV
jgi:Fe2+ or Zn2+ uptake regulation protein